jgi:hypothetical protein
LHHIDFHIVDPLSEQELIVLYKKLIAQDLARIREFEAFMRYKLLYLAGKPDLDPENAGQDVLEHIVQSRRDAMAVNEEHFVEILSSNVTFLMGISKKNSQGFRAFT